MRFEALLFLVGHYGFLILFGIWAYGIGRRLTQRVLYDSLVEQFSFCTALGLGFIAYLILLLGTLKLLHLWSVLILIGLTLLFCASAWRELFKLIFAAPWRGCPGRRRGLFFLISAFLSLPILLMPLYPPTAFDSTMYHLAYAKIFIKAHEIAFAPFLRLPVFPQTIEMLFTLALLLYDDVLAQLLQLLMMGILCVGLFAFGRRHFTPRAGIWAVAIFLSSPLVLWVGTNAYIDVGLALFVTMAGYAIFNWRYSKDRKWLLLGALLSGFAAGSKYSALFFVVLFGLPVVYAGITERRFLHSFLFLVVTAGVAFPWYLRNWYHTGNPVFPFFGPIFGYGSWNSQDFQVFDHLMRDYGTGKGLGSLLLLPWNLIFKPSRFLTEAPLSPVFLLGLPILFLRLSILKIRALFVIVLAYVLFWFSTVQQLRYLVPILPLMSLATSTAFENGLEWLSSNRLSSVRKGVATSIFFVILFAPGWFYAVDQVRKEGYPPYTDQQREIYLTQRLSSFPAYRHLNRIKGSDYSLYALFDENMAYFADGQFMGDWFGPARYEKVYNKLNNPRELHQELRKLDADYFLIRRDRVRTEWTESAYAGPYFKLVYEKETVLLFEVL